jgi:hypothetical protein
MEISECALQRSRAEKAEMDNQELLKQLTATLESNDKFQDLLEKAEKENALQAQKLIETGHELYRLREDVKPLLYRAALTDPVQAQDFLSKHPELKSE